MFYKHKNSMKDLKNQFIKRGLFLAAICTLIIAILCYVIVLTSVNNQMQIVKSHHINEVESIKTQIQDSLQERISDIQYLASNPKLLLLLQDENDKQGLKSDLTAEINRLIEISQCYDQVRVINAQGMEVVRVNWQDNKGSAVPPDKLQDKSDRYYFTDTLALNSGEIYISPMDLNKENRQIEHPLKPMIRIGMPVVNKQGKALGVVMLNYLAENILSKVKKSLDSSQESHVALINSEGYFLKAPKDKMEWGFMLSDRQKEKFSSYCPHVWDKMSINLDGQIQSDHEVFTYSTINPCETLKNNNPDNKGYSWAIISHLTKSYYISCLKKYIKTVVGFALPCLLVVYVFCWHIAKNTITRKSFQQKLQESKLFLQTVLNSQPDAILVLDLDYQIRLANTKAISNYIISDNDDKRYCYQISHQQDLPCDGEKHPCPMHLVLESKDCVTLEHQHIDNEGNTRYVEIVASPVFNQKGDVVNIIEASRDITERKLLENELVSSKFETERMNEQLKLQTKKANAMAANAEEANRAKSEFLANMSHEIRTPMNSIIGFVDLLASEDLTDEQYDYIETVKSSADSLLGLINDILDYSKIESGKYEISKQKCHLDDFFSQIDKTMGLLAEEKRLKYIAEHYTPANVSVICDSMRIRQCLINLINNAIKFTDTGFVCVKTAISKSNDRCLLNFEVEDSGIGIPADKLEHVFDSFAQADSSTTRKYGGTGLGLAITKKLIELMEGEITVQSAVGEGSTFALQIPVTVKDESLILTS